jgi:hypothetical protein
MLSGRIPPLRLVLRTQPRPAGTPGKALRLRPACLQNKKGTPVRASLAKLW